VAPFLALDLWKVSRYFRCKNAGVSFQFFEEINETKIVHSAQKMNGLDFKKPPFWHPDSLFGDSRDFIEKIVANFVDSHVRGGV
jgi:hypothetical protein